MKKTFLLSATILLSACGSDGNSQGESIENSQDIDNTPSPSLIQPIQLTNAYQSHITKLAVQPDGSWCYLERSTKETLEEVRKLTNEEKKEIRGGIFKFLQWQDNIPQSINCYMADQMTWSYHPDTKTAIADMVITENQQVVVLEAIENQDNENTYQLQLSRYSLTGELYHQRLFSHPPSQHELYNYFDKDGQLIRETKISMSIDGRPQLPGRSSASLTLKNGRLYMLATTYGLQAYQLNDDFSIRWSHQAFPEHDNLNMTSTMDVDEYGKLAIIYNLESEQDLSTYNQHFSTNLGSDSSHSKTILLETLNQDGELIQRQLVGKPGRSEQVTRVLRHDNSLLLVGNTRHEKPNAVDSTTEWDGFIHRINSNNGDLISSTLIHFDKEDKFYDADIDDHGRLWLSGRSGYIQADTNSQVTNGYGVILQLDESNNLNLIKKLELPRDSSINQLTLIDGRVYYRYDYDGSITHTCQNDNTLCWLKSGIDSIVAPRSPGSL